MKNVNANNFAVSIKICLLVFATFLLVTNLPVLAQQDMSNMPGMRMETNKDMGGMAGMPKKKAPPVLSFQRLGYGLEMIGALGNTHHFGFDWQREQHYVGPVFSYSLSKQWTVHFEPAFGLSNVSDPLMLRMGLGYSIDHLLHRRSKTP